MERLSRAAWFLVCLAVLSAAAEARAQYAVQIGIKQTDGRWKDTLLAGETNILTISITNPVDVAAYTLPFIISSASGGAFAAAGGEASVTYVGRMATAGNPFTIRSVNVLGVNGATPDSLLFGAVEFGINFLPAGTGIVIEHPFTVGSFIGQVRIDTGRITPSNILSFSLPDATEITAVDFNALPIFPVVLRVPNAGPSCTPPADVNTPFGVEVQRTVIGSDPEGNALSFKQISGPGTTTAAGLWKWTPGCPDVGSYQVCVTVSDPNHKDWDTCCFAVTVTQSAPTLSCIDQTVHAGNTLSYFLAGADDGCPQPLKYFKTAGPGTINPTTGEYTYATVCVDKGIKFIDAGVTDGKDTALCTFKVTVTNATPVINCPPDFSSGIGDTVDFQIVATDADGDPLTFTLLSFTKLSGPTPGGPNIAPTLSPTGLFFWPTTKEVNDDDFGVWEVALRVDEPCDSAFCTFEIEVTPNRPPVCQVPSGVKARWDEGTASVPFTFFDPDGDSISFQQISGPGSIDAGGVWSWSFGCGDVGTYEICAMVADSSFPGGDTCCFTFTINQTAPALTCQDASVHAGAAPLVINLTAPDDGCPGNPVRFYKISGPGTLDSITGVFTFSTLTASFGCNDLGTYDIVLYATDGALADTCQFEVRVYNNPPLFTCPLDTLEHTVDKLFTLDTQLKDVDGDAFDTVFIRSFVKLSGPAGGPNNPPAINTAGVVTWQTDSSNTNDLGVWRMILEARDTCAVSRCTLFVRTYPNRPPTCLTSNTSGHVGDTAYGGVLGLDPDGDLLSFVQISGPGSIVVAENAARWTWVPDCLERGEYDVCVVVSDAVFSEADTCCFHVTIYENPPVINCSDQSVHYGQTLTYDIPFVDDGCPRPGHWSVIGGPGTIDSLTGRYTLPTECGDLGTVAVTVALNDSLRADTCSFDVDITNTPPFVNCPLDIEGLKVGVTVDFNIPFGDTDGDPTTIALTGFQKLGGANPNPPNNAPTLDLSGHFVWVTDQSNLNDVATWEVFLRADEPCDSAFCSFRIEILPNEAPTCSAPNDTNATCGELISSSFGFADTEGDAVTFDLISGPGDVGSSSGVWSWNAPCDSGGLYEVCVTVSDFLHPDADTCCFVLSMCAVSEPGDVDGSGTAEAADIIILVNYMFKGGIIPFGPYTADMNCDGVPDSKDIITLVNYIFKSGAIPCDACTSPLFPGVGP